MEWSWSRRVRSPDGRVSTASICSEARRAKERRSHATVVDVVRRETRRLSLLERETRTRDERAFPSRLERVSRRNVVVVRPRRSRSPISDVSFRETRRFLVYISVSRVSQGSPRSGCISEGKAHTNLLGRATRSIQSPFSPLSPPAGVELLCYMVAERTVQFLRLAEGAPTRRA